MSVTNLVADVVSVPVVRHSDGNVRQDKRGARNTVNNHQFGTLTEVVTLTPAVPATADTPETPAVTQSHTSLVEIVRMGKSHTRIRRDLMDNGVTELVETQNLSNVGKRARKVAEVTPVEDSLPGLPSEDELVNIMTGETMPVASGSDGTNEFEAAHA